MTDIRRFVPLPSLAILCFALGCERSKPVPVAESVKTVVGSTTEVAPQPALATWDEALGPVLLIGGNAPLSAEVLAEAGIDTNRLQGTRVVLLGRGGESQPASLAKRTVPADDACAGLGAWQLATSTGALGAWSVGFAAKDQVSPLPMDSVETLSSADSASLAAEMTRLASTSAGNESKRFSGLPFSVQSLWRFSPAPGVSVVAANLIRKLNLEASPLEERTTIIAEREGAANKYSLAYEERSQGDEETVESRDFVAALRLGAGGTPVIVMTHDYDEEIAYSILERVGPGKWRVRWTSPRVAC